jgi:hypothetical protein
MRYGRLAIISGSRGLRSPRARMIPLSIAVPFFDRTGG